MQYSITPYSENIEPYAWWEGAFNEQELNLLQEKAKEADTAATIGMGAEGVLNQEIRRSSLKWMPILSETEWVFEKLAHIVSELNAKYFRFDLRCFGEAIQLTNYDASVQGMYGWHIDYGGEGPNRKLSLVMQLSDPNAYEGGILELKHSGKEVTTIPKKRGLIVVFPSWTLHQVTPVTSGSRQSLVSWITGPAFK